MTSDVSRWFDRFAAFGRAPSPDSYAAFFHPEGEVADAGMAAETATRPTKAVAARMSFFIGRLPFSARRIESARPSNEPAARIEEPRLSACTHHAMRGLTRT